MTTYHAFPYAKMNQSFKMENENNQSICEANMVKFKLFGASDYEFINYQTASTVQRTVGKTNSVEGSVGGLTMSEASYFKLDGKNCFDILDEKGYSFKLSKLHLLHPEFVLQDRSGNILATYKMNVSGEREEGVLGIGNKQSNTVIETESDDLDTIFLGAFIMAHVNF